LLRYDRLSRTRPKHMKSRRSAATLTLVLIGTAGLPGCNDDAQTAARDVYRTRADCQRDWGDDPNKCEYQNSGSHTGFWFGPSYGYGGTCSAGGTMPARNASSAVGRAVTRGGFGSSASAHASGG
jgi:uncharacterized protein YgiB involved in biofilm formation